MLLYAKTDEEQPNQQFKMSGNTIWFAHLIWTVISLRFQVN